MKAIRKYGKNKTRVYEDWWCHSKLIAFCEKIADFLIKGQVVDLIYLVLSKSFDMVSDIILLVKAYNIGIRTKIVVWETGWSKETEMDIIRRGQFRIGKGYFQILQRRIYRLILLNNFIKDFVQNRYKLMKFIVEMMLRGIVCVLGGENIQEKLYDLKDWTYRKEANLIYLCAWPCSFTLMPRLPALLGDQPLEISEEEKYLYMLFDPEIMCKWKCVTQNV